MSEDASELVTYNPLKNLAEQLEQYKQAEVRDCVAVELYW